MRANHNTHPYDKATGRRGKCRENKMNSDFCAVVAFRARLPQLETAIMQLQAQKGYRHPLTNGSKPD
jgi:hypothetical protein